MVRKVSVLWSLPANINFDASIFPEGSPILAVPVIRWWILKGCFAGIYSPPHGETNLAGVTVGWSQRGVSLFLAQNLLVWSELGSLYNRLCT